MPITIVSWKRYLVIIELDPFVTVFGPANVMAGVDGATLVSKNTFQVVPTGVVRPNIIAQISRLVLFISDWFRFFSANLGSKLLFYLKKVSPQIRHTFFFFLASSSISLSETIFI